MKTISKTYLIVHFVTLCVIFLCLPVDAQVIYDYASKTFSGSRTLPANKQHPLQIKHINRLKYGLEVRVDKLKYINYSPISLTQLRGHMDIPVSGFIEEAIPLTCPQLQLEYQKYKIEFEKTVQQKRVVRSGLDRCWFSKVKS